MLSLEEIKSFIDEDSISEKKRFAAIGQRYYEGRHDIRDYRMFYFDANGVLKEDTTRTNMRISHPFFMILTDQLSAYMLSFKENPIQAKENTNGLQTRLDSYFDDDFWAEIGEVISGAYVKGFEYLYAYKNKKDRTAFQCADSLGVVEVRAKDTDDHCEHVIFWYIDRIEKGMKKIKRIQVWDSQQIYYYTQIDNGEIVLDESEELNPKPHSVFEEEDGVITYDDYGMIPFFRLDNCKKQFSGLMPVKELIDDYDIHACSLSNNLIDFDMPLHVVKGFQGDNLDELQQNLQTKKLIGIPETDGGVEVHTVEIPYQARKEKLQIDKEGIYTFGMGFDPTQTGDGNITNIVIRNRYSMLDLKAGKMQPRLQALLDKCITIVLNEINQAEGTDYSLEDIEYHFTRETTTNETENISNEKIKAETKQIQVNTILNAAANIGDEQTLRALCEVLEWDFEEIQAALKKAETEGLESARNALESVQIEENIENTLE